MSPLPSGRFRLLGVAMSLALLAAACGTRLGAAPDGGAVPAPCVSEAVPDRTPGVAAFATLGAGVAPQLVAFRGDVLFVTAFVPCEDTHELMLWTLDTRTRAATALPLHVTTAGLWHALAVADDGTVWVGTRDVLVHVHTDRRVEWISVPPARAPVPAGFASRAGSPNAVGAITALAAVGDTIVLGRAGHQEITTFSTPTQRFAHLTLPSPFGEVKTLVAGPRSHVIFTATRSGTDPLGASDAAGVLEIGAERSAELPILPGVVTASGDHVAYASWRAVAGGVRAELGVVDARGVTRWSADAQDYDATRFALRRDGTVAVRLSGAAAEVAFIGPDGRETRRVPYAAVRDPAAPSVPALAFAVFGPSDALWFAVRGRPEIYRIP